MTQKQHDVINAPSHYTKFGEAYEPINVIEAWELNFQLGNAVKYIPRAGEKLYEGKTALESKIIDLKKSRWYLDREISNLEAEQNKITEVALRSKMSPAQFDRYLKLFNDYNISNAVTEKGGTPYLFPILGIEKVKLLCDSILAYNENREVFTKGKNNSITITKAPKKRPSKKSTAARK